MHLFLLRGLLVGCLCLIGQAKSWTNITVYHVNQASFGAAPVNMDTGDALGDMYFDFRSVGLPIECRGPASKARDCQNAEVTSADLVITELVLTVDGNYGPYGRCNVCVNGTDHHGHDHCKDGTYVCGCGDYGHLEPCGAPVGRENISEHFGGEDCRQGDPNWECWRANVAKKTGGLWFSTTEQGWCDGPVAAAGCTWRVAQAVKRVNKSCSDNRIYDRLEAADKSGCFDHCGTVRNTSSDCWIGCFYQTLLGPHTDQPRANVAGVPQEMLLEAWRAPFESDDPQQGGCPPLPIPSGAEQIRAW